MILIIQTSLLLWRKGKADQDPAVLSEAIELVQAVSIFGGDCFILPRFGVLDGGTAGKKKRTAGNNNGLLRYGFHNFDLTRRIHLMPDWTLTNWWFIH